jgi:hypothetical protein
MTSAKTLNDCITAFLASVGRHAVRMRRITGDWWWLTGQDQQRPAKRGRY